MAKRKVGQIFVETNGDVTFQVEGDAGVKALMFIGLKMMALGAEAAADEAKELKRSWTMKPKKNVRFK